MNYTFIYLFVIISIFYIYNNLLIEKFQNYVNPFFKNKSFCSYDKDLSKCKCTYQKDGINIPFNSTSSSCNNECLNKSKENCNKNINKSNNLYYYCKKDNKCIKYQGTNLNKYISVNNCGIDKLTNQIKLPYLTKDSCLKSISVCDKYNKNNYSKSEKKKKCLENTSCGFCTNKFGDGLCLEGTPDGPLNSNSNCSPNNFQNNSNKYEYGNHQFNF